MAVRTIDKKTDLFGHRLQTRWLRHESRKPARAPVLVFLHEGLGSIELWGDFPQSIALGTGLDAFLYDRLGHGRSDPLPAAGIDMTYQDEEIYRYLPGILEQQGISRPIFIGHSDGGTIALLYAAKYSGTVGIVTEAAHVFVDDLTVKGIRNAVAAYKAGALESRLRKYHGDNLEPLFWRWADTWTHPAFASWNVEDHLPRITCPVLAIQGRDDEYGIPAQAESIAAKVGGFGRAWLVPDCRHIPHRQARGPVTRAICDFIDTCCPVLKV